ncbi:nuclear receptor-binding factor 2 isoform X2 [Agrilus planipennis]|uniref:Nuclear receptor-binding factor 2 isoform X2 n=1 Tax=Agrilus planipennis TaxID=224129 RepID=A0A1W4WZV6_AGRPL|nr:nuclear receptor-binding factor 2 isoform X2 [Agrilus planipennis]
MEPSSLNKAHQQHRRADALLKYKKFEEAIECHEKAAELLEEAIKVTENPHSIESLKLQKDYHLRQKKIILMKKEQSVKTKKVQGIQKQGTHLSNCSENDHNLDDNASLQSAIYRTFEETDSLLFLLMKKGAKHPKDDTVVIEELKTLNDQLRHLISNLLVQLDESSKEINRLRDRVKQLEEDGSKATSKCTTANNLKVITDSSGATSPYVFSPCSELSPDLYDISTIPPLAPLEIPNFDFSNLTKNS